MLVLLVFTSGMTESIVIAVDADSILTAGTKGADNTVQTGVGSDTDQVQQ